jgi:hypothetical protein
MFSGDYEEGESMKEIEQFGDFGLVEYFINKIESEL